MSTYTFIYQTPESPERHKHEHAQLMIGIEGITDIEIEDSRLELNQMLGCVIPSQTYHRFSGARDNLNLTINFDLKHSTDIVKRICESPRTFTLDKSLQTFLKFSALELPKYQGSTDIGRSHFCQNFISIFTKLLSDRLLSHPEAEKRIDIGKIDRYLEGNMDRRIPVSDLARISHISPSHFYILFRQEEGVTPHQYILEKRLERAMFLLKTSHLSITDISYMTGFSSQSALSNSFKKRYSITPGSAKRIDSSTGSNSPKDQSSI